MLTSFPFNVILAIDIGYNVMTKKKSTKNWLKKHTKDKYVKMSISSHYRSRAFHKLQEIDEKYKIIKSSNIIIDLGHHLDPGPNIYHAITNKKNLLPWTR